MSEKRISGFLLLVLGAVQVGLCTMLAMARNSQSAAISAAFAERLNKGKSALFQGEDLHESYLNAQNRRLSPERAYKKLPGKTWLPCSRRVSVQFLKTRGTSTVQPGSTPGFQPGSQVFLDSLGCVLY